MNLVALAFVFIAAIPGWWWDKLDDAGRDEMVNVHAAGLFHESHPGCKNAAIHVQRVIVKNYDQVQFLGRCTDDDPENPDGSVTAWDKQ